jgi:hypothetical protein
MERRRQLLSLSRHLERTNQPHTPSPRRAKSPTKLTMHTPFFPRPPTNPTQNTHTTGGGRLRAGLPQRGLYPRGPPGHGLSRHGAGARQGAVPRGTFPLFLCISPATESNRTHHSIHIGSIDRSISIDLPLFHLPHTQQHQVQRADDIVVGIGVDTTDGLPTATMTAADSRNGLYPAPPATHYEDGNSSDEEGRLRRRCVWELGGGGRGGLCVPIY